MKEFQNITWWLQIFTLLTSKNVLYVKNQTLVLFSYPQFTNPGSVQGVRGFIRKKATQIHSTLNPFNVVFKAKTLKLMSHHQAAKDEDQLYNICVCHGVEASQQCVDDGNSGRDSDAHREGQVQNHAHSSSYETH